MNTIIPDNVTTIGSKAFCSCRKLSSILLPNSITTIEDSAFYECTALDSITIPKNTTKIGQSAFSLCKSLQYILWNAKKCNDFFNQYYSPFVYDYYVEGNNYIKSFVFGETSVPISIGRINCLLNINHSSISKTHAVIDFSNDSKKFYFKDLKSTNGTTLIMKEDDSLRIKGEMKFKLDNIPFKLWEMP
jgi:hypothetical protein